MHETRFILVAGIAGAFTGAMSMGCSAYISSKSQSEFFLAEINRERKEIREMPDREKEEVRKIYRAKGFSGEELEMVTNRITSNKSVWLRCMMEEELGLIVENFDVPWVVGLVTAVSYALSAFFPIIPYALMPPSKAFLWSAVLSVLVLFLLGAGKTKLTHLSPWKSGFEMMIIGLLSALVGYGVGCLAGTL